MASYDVFTPKRIADQMRSYLPNHVNRLLEPSVGTGALLSVMEGTFNSADVYDINADYLAQVSMQKVNKIHGDFITATVEGKYDAILLNPPYQRFQEMDKTQRSAVRALSPILGTGNIDLYVAFLVKCIQCLTDDGTMVAIVPSTWLYNRSCSKFREWVFESKYVSTIHDFGSEKVFPGIDVYCCIVVFTKTDKQTYTRNGDVISYDPIANVDKVYLGSVCDIQNGVATLCDEVFIHATPLFDEPCWRAILKVSKQIVRHIIYPYDESGKIIPEDTFSQSNPQTYAYLQTQRERLAKRDRGNKTYEAWYAYGRRQGLTIPNQKESVYVSTLSLPTIPSFIRETMLFYSGLRITPHSMECSSVQSLLVKSAGQIQNVCSKRSNDWINVTATALKQVQVPE